MPLDGLFFGDDGCYDIEESGVHSRSRERPMSQRFPRKQHQTVSDLPGIRAGQDAKPVHPSTTTRNRVNAQAPPMAVFGTQSPSEEASLGRRVVQLLGLLTTSLGLVVGLSRSR